MSLLIKAEHISHQFAQTEVLNNVSLEIHSGEIVTLIGPNGAGKSTLLKILLNLLQPTAGKVTRRSDLNIGFMPQKIQIDPTFPMTVGNFLNLGRPKRNNDTNGWKRFFNFSAHDTTEIQEVIDELNIRHLLNQPIQKVSGGQMQRILLARALIREPNLLVLDEPVQGVDLQGQTELYHYINELRKRRNLGILMVSHDLHIVMRNTDQVLCLNQHLCCSGTPQTVSQTPEFIAIFGQAGNELALYEHHHDHDQCDMAHGHHHAHSTSDKE
ncbi:ATP-binding cassette domain-containing protein [Thiomicrorhabdus sp. ZW0627]|uniref:ATP-binding cassette domain-containing protein n=1 Tax=Thiomicrorhabdus sp. ZW0627 TaxID=3039774 RepID=UPI0024365CAF|nr:ATP-binding cassette domain-containing protein [Thiomicrorhabdus sp. ZW0627]MDG6774031.1 ATP-binding cassette domain-containing protein [Thiomicrorhabdus sp. ZW0627]